ncbi:DUF2484 family protein [Cognatiyoonia sp. IB215182]|uniref:DUF2484 family protein n=1 Tax=Cognatiyoonia sp. IB215182 TaxID=3097353 RepID=UPI002A0C8548|nr:DUF2484 family protein [Cognatiyoonia sp. IB215182]MDX8351310.1 DUF2484 family protein [Cognatiyoonia sp. IB215182]
MSLSLFLLCLWVVVAFVMAAIPSNDKHWRRAYVLMALGAPLLAFLIWEGGILMGLLGLVVGGLVLRWPVRYLVRWVKRQMGISG